MSEYIKKEDAIQALNSLNILKNARKLSELIIDSIPLENRLRWTPVSERLPKRDEDVLVTTKYEDVRIMYRTDDIFKSPDYWTDGDFIFDDEEILAWMPLPETYKESEQ